jgi:hypothetical protein
MAKQARKTQADVVALVAVTPFCDAPDVVDFTPEQQAALHVFKHEVLAAGYRLYQSVPPSMAGPLLAKFMKGVVIKLN